MLFLFCFIVSTVAKEPSLRERRSLINSNFRNLETSEDYKENEDLIRNYISECKKRYEGKSGKKEDYCVLAGVEYLIKLKTLEKQYGEVEQLILDKFDLEGCRADKTFENSTFFNCKKLMDELGRFYEENDKQKFEELMVLYIKNLIDYNLSLGEKSAYGFLILQQYDVLIAFYINTEQFNKSELTLNDALAFSEKDNHDYSKPKQVNLFYMLGINNIRLGNFEKSETYLIRALKSHEKFIEDNPDVKDLLAIVLVRMETNEALVEVYKKLGDKKKLAKSEKVYLALKAKLNKDFPDYNNRSLREIELLKDVLKKYQ